MSLGWRTIRIAESVFSASYGYECDECGALCWGSGKKKHEDWHNKQTLANAAAHRADSMTRVIGSGPGKW